MIFLCELLPHPLFLGFSKASPSLVPRFLPQLPALPYLSSPFSLAPWALPPGPQCELNFLCSSYHVLFQIPPPFLTQLFLVLFPSKWNGVLTVASRKEVHPDIVTFCENHEFTGKERTLRKGSYVLEITTRRKNKNKTNSGVTTKDEPTG